MVLTGSAFAGAVNIPEELAKQKIVDGSSYDIGQAICYRYEHLKKRGLPYETIGFDLPVVLIDLPRDRQLQASFLAWFSIFRQGFVSSYSKEGIAISGAMRSGYLQRLRRSDGFIKAIEECSQRTGDDMMPIVYRGLDRENNTADRIGAFVVPIYGFAILSKLGVLNAAWQASIKLASKVGVSAGALTMTARLAMGTLFLTQAISIYERVRGARPIQDKIDHHQDIFSGEANEIWSGTDQGVINFSKMYLANQNDPRIPGELGKLIKYKRDLIKRREILETIIRDHVLTVEGLNDLITRYQKGDTLSPDQLGDISVGALASSIDLILSLGDSLAVTKTVTE